MWQSLFTAALCKEGHTVEFEETPDWNRVELWVNGQCVYKCCVGDLDYGENQLIL